MAHPSSSLTPLAIGYVTVALAQTRSRAFRVMGSWVPTGIDVLSGTYELQPLPNGRTRLVLYSEHRTSTSFNPYAVWWADRVMSSIQRNILAILRDRAEGATG